MTPVCASELPSLCLLDGSEHIFAMVTIALIVIIIIIVINVLQHITGRCTPHNAEHCTKAQLNTWWHASRTMRCNPNVPLHDVADCFW